MMFIDEMYQQSVAENDKNLRFWEDYLNNLRSLDFSVYTEKLKVPTLVPVGSRMFFRGELKHTNEVTVSLGADYFVKCSIQQAEILRQHRIKDAQSKVDVFRQEKQYLENHLSFTKQKVYDKVGQEIIEQFTEEEDKAWRKQHQENVRKYKQGKAKEDIKPTEDIISDNALLERLEELELQEELENEMLDNYYENADIRKDKNFLDNGQNVKSLQKENNKLQSQADIIFEPKDNLHDLNKNKIEATNSNYEDTSDSKESSKDKLLQQVLNKQNELEMKLHELKNRDREKSRTEQDLISKLDELEQLEELEDDINRLDEILETEDVDSEVDPPSLEYSQSDSTKPTKCIHFENKDDCKTVEITFRHDTTEPSNILYNPENGITKPSNIYEAFPHLFVNNPKSILKKSKYDSEEKIVDQTKHIKFRQNVDSSECTVMEEIPIIREIIINDVVVEKPSEKSLKKIEMGARPTSLFKKKRLQQMKS